jgi:hypothetical protein
MGDQDAQVPEFLASNVQAEYAKHIRIQAEAPARRIALLAAGAEEPV